MECQKRVENASFYVDDVPAFLHLDGYKQYRFNGRPGLESIIRLLRRACHGAQREVCTAIIRL